MDAALGADARNVLRRGAQQILDLLRHIVGHGRRQVDLVDDGYDGQVLVQRGEEVRHGLRLDALAGVHDEHGALARLQGPVHLVAEVHVAWGVDEVDLIFLVAAPVDHAHGAGFDGDALLALQIHGVEQLLAHLALGHRIGDLQQAVGQRALAVIDMGDDRKVANVIEIHGRNYNPRLTPTLTACGTRRWSPPCRPRAAPAAPNPGRGAPW